MTETASRSDRLHVAPHPPTRGEMATARTGDFLVYIDRSDTGRHVGAVVLGTVEEPYAVKLRGKIRGRFASWIQAVEFIRSIDMPKASR